MKRLLSFGALIALLVYLGWPQKVYCGMPLATCAIPGNEPGSYSVSYEIQPRIISRREKKQRKNANIHYAEGKEVEQLDLDDDAVIRTVAQGETLQREKNQIQVTDIKENSIDGRVWYEIFVVVNGGEEQVINLGDIISLGNGEVSITASQVESIGNTTGFEVEFEIYD